MTKNKFGLIALLILFSALNLPAQTLRFKQTELKSTSLAAYLGNDGTYHYYKSLGTSYVRLEIANLANSKRIDFNLDKDYAYPSEVYFLNQKIYAVSKHTEKKEGSKETSSSFFIYKINPSDGSIDKKVFYTNKDTMGYFRCVLDTVQNCFFIKKSDSVYAVYDFQLEPSNEKHSKKGKKKPSNESDLARLFSELSFGFNITLGGDFLSNRPEKHKDSLSSNHFKFSFERRKDKDIYYFNAVIQNIVIETQKPMKPKSVDFAIDIDKSIIDINYRENAEGELIVWGKYIQKGKSSSGYGMFSAVYDAQLNQKSNTKFFDLVNIPNIEGSNVPNVKYVGFIFNDLFDADYEFYFDDPKTFVFTYQKKYSNLQDHVYLLKIEASGEITVNVIHNQIKTDKKNNMTEKHMALKVGNNIHILFYENPENIGKSAQHLDMEETVLGTKKCVLAYTTYKVLEDDFTNKTLISDIKSLGNFPHLMSPVIYFDGDKNQYTAIVKGWNKQKELVSLFEFYYVD